MLRFAILTFVVAGLVVPAHAGPPAAATATDKAPATGQWTGFVTDTHCGAKGASKDHTTACLDKCMKSGSKAQILNETDKKLYDLDGGDKVRSLVGKRVTIKGTLDAKTGAIAVTSAEAAAESK